MNAAVGSVLIKMGMRLMPRLSGMIERRVLIGLRVRPDVAARIIPPPLQPRIIKGWNIAGVCLIRLGGLRPTGLPEWSGRASENAAHRFAVQWLEGGRTHDGVFIAGRDTDSVLNTMLGGRIVPGRHHRADFQVWEADHRLRIGCERRDDECSMKMVARVVDEWPAGSVFGSHAEASAFYRSGSLGWSDRGDGRLDAMELDCVDWVTKPLLVERFESSWFQCRNRFPQGSVEFDSALLMRNVRHTWRVRGRMRIDARHEQRARPFR